MLRKTSKSTKSYCEPSTTTVLTIKPCPQVLHPQDFEPFQGWWLHQCPWGLAQRACLTAVVCWAVSAKPNLAVGVKLAGSLLKRKENPWAQFTSKPALAFVSCVCWVPALCTKRKMKNPSTIRIYRKNIQIWFLEFAFAKLPQGDVCQSCTLTVSCSGSSQSHNMQLYPCTGRTQNVWNYNEAAGVSTSSVQWLPINHCSLNCLLLWSSQMVSRYKWDHWKENLKKDRLKQKIKILVENLIKTVVLQSFIQYQYAIDWLQGGE